MSLDQNSAMEEILTRYPHIFMSILCNLDSKTLANCRLVNKIFKHCIDNERLLWIRIIERYFGDQIEYHDTWKKVLDKATFNITKRIGLAVLKFFQTQDVRALFVSVVHISTTVFSFLLMMASIAFM